MSIFDQGRFLMHQMAEEDVPAVWKRPEMCCVPHSPQQGVTHLLSEAVASARSSFPTCCLFSGGKGRFSKRGISPATPPRLHFLKPKFDNMMNWFHMNTSAAVLGMMFQTLLLT